MATKPLYRASSLPALTAQGGKVWDRLWRYTPSVEKDDSLLDREWRGHRWQLIVDRLEQTFGTIKGLRTIELGAGRGDLSALLARRGADVTLLDASELAHAQARNRFGRLDLSASYVTGDMLRLDKSLSCQFDDSLSSGVIEHFTDDQRTRCLEAHHQVLRPGGIAIVSVPHAMCPSYRLWKFYLETRGWWPYGMELPYTKRELVRRATSVGFGRVEVAAVGFWQSVGDHWFKSVFGRQVDFSARRSMFDSALGMTALCFSWRTHAQDAGE